MSKLKLSVDELRVESFATSATVDARGTVRGADAGTNQSGCIIASCGVTCPIGCEHSNFDLCEDTSFKGCEGTNESGCIIASCGVTCPITCEETCRAVCGG